MMTLYMLFAAIKSGRLSMNDALPVSAAAAKQPASKLGLKAGETIRVRDAMLALTRALGERCGRRRGGGARRLGAAFASRMTARAQALGMSSTRFRNASGLPDPGRSATARDMALLARACRWISPSRYRIFATRAFAYKGRELKSTNQLWAPFPASTA